MVSQQKSASKARGQVQQVSPKSGLAGQLESMGIGSEALALTSLGLLIAIIGLGTYTFVFRSSGSQDSIFNVVHSMAKAAEHDEWKQNVAENLNSNVYIGMNVFANEFSSVASAKKFEKTAYDGKVKDLKTKWDALEKEINEAKDEDAKKSKRLSAVTDVAGKLKGLKADILLPTKVDHPGSEESKEKVKAVTELTKTSEVSQFINAHSKALLALIEKTKPKS